MFAFNRPSNPPPVGLLVVGKDTSVPLKKVLVSAHLNGYLVGLESTLKYNNDSKDPLEVQFRFPVEESFAVVGLEAVIGGRKIKAEVREKEEAKQKYDDAMASGFTAALAEETTGDIFSISLGNLPPMTEAEIHLKLAGELPIDAEGGVRFTLPAVLKPRYTPTGSSDPLAPQPQGPGSQVSQATAPAVFDFTMTVAESEAISSITSPTHTIATQSKSGQIHVSLQNTAPLESDLIVLVEYSDPHQPKAIVEPGDPKLSQQEYMGSPAVMLNFFPKFEVKRAACEFIFVIDRSGSMRGSYIKSARETLALFLKSIPPGCSFNIIGFGSSYTSLFPSSVPYNQQNLDEAIQHSESVQADLGGTELLEPLEHIFRQEMIPGLPRQVFVLTDGSVGNTYSCIQEVKNHVKHTRVFTFGIGSGASTELVKGLAKAGNGTAEFVHEGERMQPKVIRSLKRALQPAVTDLKVNFEMPFGFEVLQAPAKLPSLFNGDKTVIYGIFKNQLPSEGPLEVNLKGSAILKGKILDQPIEHAVPFEIPKASDFQQSFQIPIVHQLASKSLIKDWQNKEGWSESAKEEERKKEIIKLSIESSVISSHTAYIAVDEEQDQPIEGAVKSWDITAGLAHHELGSGSFFGFGGTRLRSMQPVSLSFNYCAPPPPPGGVMYAPASAPPPPSGCGLFGNAPPPPQFGGGLVGSLGSAAPPPPSGGGLFGSAAPPPPSGGGLFGSFGSAAPPPPSRDGLFQSAPQFTGGFDLLGSAAPPPQPTAGLFGSAAPPLRSTMGGGGLIFGSAVPPPQSAGGFGGSLFGSSAPPPAPASTGLPLLISLQQAEGFWRLKQLAEDFLHKSLDELTSKCPVKCADEIWATVIALVYMESKFPRQRDEWELVAMKAEMWLDDQSLPSGTSVAALKEAAKRSIIM